MKCFHKTIWIIIAFFCCFKESVICFSDSFVFLKSDFGKTCAFVHGPKQWFPKVDISALFGVSRKIQGAERGTGSREGEGGGIGEEEGIRTNCGKNVCRGVRNYGLGDTREGQYANVLELKD